MEPTEDKRNLTEAWKGIDFPPGVTHGSENAGAFSF